MTLDAWFDFRRPNEWKRWFVPQCFVARLPFFSCGVGEIPKWHGFIKPLSRDSGIYLKMRWRQCKNQMCGRPQGNSMSRHYRTVAPCPMSGPMSHVRPHVPCLGRWPTQKDLHGFVFCFWFCFLPFFFSFKSLCWFLGWFFLLRERKTLLKYSRCICNIWCSGPPWVKGFLLDCSLLRLIAGMALPELSPHYEQRWRFLRMHQGETAESHVTRHLLLSCRHISLRNACRPLFLNL